MTAVKAAEEEEDMGEDELANLVEELLKINEVNMEDFEEEDQEEDEGKEETAEAAAHRGSLVRRRQQDQSSYQSGDDPTTRCQRAIRSSICPPLIPRTWKRITNPRWKKRLKGWNKNKTWPDDI